MKKIVLLSLAASALLMAANEKKDPNALKTHTELGFTDTQGNTRTQNFSLDFAGSKAFDKHQFRLDFDAIYGTNNNIENVNKVLTELNYDYSFTEVLAANYVVGYKNDKFSGFDYQFYTGPGAKYTVLKGDVHNLNTQLNIVYSRDNEQAVYYSEAALTNKVDYPYTGVTQKFKDPASGKIKEYTAALLKADYSWKFTDNSTFKQEASYRVDASELERYFIYSKTALESKISDYFSMGLSYKVDYTNLPVDGKERTDRTAVASLIIDY